MSFRSNFYGSKSPKRCLCFRHICFYFSITIDLISCFKTFKIFAFHELYYSKLVGFVLFFGILIVRECQKFLSLIYLFVHFFLKTTGWLSSLKIAVEKSLFFDKYRNEEKSIPFLLWSCSCPKITDLCFKKLISVFSRKQLP